MHQVSNFGDDRQTAGCALCGKEPETRDHVPPRVFLDEPFPENLPIINACEKCNNGASSDEEYTACFIDCVLTGTVGAHPNRRSKIERILERQLALKARIQASAVVVENRRFWKPDEKRVERVVLKIARGLVAYELNEPRHEPPGSLISIPLLVLAERQRDVFENVPQAAGWPEVGSRAMQRLITGQDVSAEWVIVQPRRFRYALFCEGSMIVARLVFSEYLAAEVIWY